MQRTAKDNYDYGEKIIGAEKSVGKRLFEALTQEVSADDKIISTDEKNMTKDWSQFDNAIMAGDWDAAKKASLEYNKNSKKSAEAQSRSTILKKIRSQLQSL